LGKSGGNQHGSLLKNEGLHRGEPPRKQLRIVCFAAFDEYSSKSSWSIKSPAQQVKSGNTATHTPDAVKTIRFKNFDTFSFPTSHKDKAWPNRILNGLSTRGIL
jgi:hypothetical protein